MKSSTLLTVRYAETDQMGIVHHSNYPIWFEAGRTDFFSTIGQPYGQIEKLGVIAPLIGMKVQFRLPALYGDQVKVETKMSSLSVVKMRFAYNVIRQQDGHLLATGETEHAWTDSALKPVNLFKRDPQLFHQLNQVLST